MFVEATLDFPEEDIEFVHAADVRGRIAAIAAQVAGVQARAKQGALLREGIAVVLVGRPNVGKSSLLNRLSGDAVAIVTPIAGTTRDAVPSQIEIHGIPLTIVDTAGLRATDDPIETLGIERTWAAVAKADLALVLVDAAAGGGIAEADAAILAQMPAALPRLLVHNKIDLADLPAIARERSDGGQSRTRGLPVGEDRSGHRPPATRNPRARRRARGHGGRVSGAGAPRHRTARCGAAISPRRRDMSRPRSRRSSSWRRICARRTTALGAITGQFTSDDLLGVIFSRFCIGK